MITACGQAERKLFGWETAVEARSSSSSSECRVLSLRRAFEALCTRELFGPCVKEKDTESGITACQQSLTVLSLRRAFEALCARELFV